MNLLLQSQLFSQLSESYPQDAKQLALQLGRPVREVQAALHALVQVGAALESAGPHSHEAGPVAGEGERRESGHEPKTSKTTRYARHSWHSVLEACRKAQVSEANALSVTLSKRHVQRLSAALELTARLGLWQLEALSREAMWAHALDPDSHFQQVEACEQELAAFKVAQSGYSQHASAGIYNPQVSPLFRQAFAAHRLLRHRLAWDQQPQGGFGVDFDEPHGVSISMMVLRQDTRPDAERPTYVLWLNEDSLRVLKWATGVYAAVLRGELVFLKRWQALGLLSRAGPPNLLLACTPAWEAVTQAHEVPVDAAEDPSFLPVSSAVLRNCQKSETLNLLAQLEAVLQEPTPLHRANDDAPEAPPTPESPHLTGPLRGWAFLAGKVYLVAQDLPSETGQASMVLVSGSHSPQTALLKAQARAGLRAVSA